MERFKILIVNTYIKFFLNKRIWFRKNKGKSIFSYLIIYLVLMIEDTSRRLGTQQAAQFLPRIIIQELIMQEHKILKFISLSTMAVSFVRL